MNNKYNIEQHTTIEYIICYKEDKLNVCIAKCNDKKLAEKIQSLLTENDKANEDYCKLVTKFDDCRGAIARAVEKLGIDPSNSPDDVEWHEWLIEQLDEKLKG